MGKRIEYLDAMRGLAMLLVVTGHVFYFSFKDTENIIFQILNFEIQLPLFFMVSGFLIKVPICDYWTFFKRKAFLLCVPATLFLTIYVWLYNYDYISSWVDNNKMGYWFTFSLLEFIVLYTVLKLCSRKMRLNINADNIFVLSITILILFFIALIKYMNIDSSIITLFGLTQFRYFPYFILGSILKEQNILKDKLFSIQTLGILLLTICFLFHLILYKYNISNFQYELCLIPTTILGLLVLLWGFEKYTTWSTSWTGKKLQIIGRYTLDIYFIHYFFLPRNLSIIGDWFKQYSNPIIEYVLALIIAAMLIVVSMFIGRIIRLSSLLAHWLLGEKK